MSSNFGAHPNKPDTENGQILRTGALDSVHGTSCKLCEYTAQYPGFKHRRSSLAKLFHAPCSKCQSWRRPKDLSLCTFCTHLRLDHIFKCRTTNTMVFLNILTLDTIRDRQSYCQLCHFFSMLIGNHGTICGVWKSNSSASLDSERTLHQGWPITPNSLKTYVDWQKVCSWIEATPPGKSINDHLSWNLKGLKVIDVYQDRLIDAPTGCQYLALSYVFGGVILNKEAVTSSGGIIRDYLPSTIRDAMTACGRLSVSYLWVDQLCIDQGSSEHLHQQINQMTLVYQNATCTLVALDGTDAHAGLPGVGSRRVWKPAYCSLGGILIAETTSNIDQYYSQCVWPTRGWTFQEAMFSAQLLFLTKAGAYFVRRDGNRWTDPLLEVNYGQRGSIPIPALSDYWSSLHAYTARHLTFGGDAIRAFTGVLRNLYGPNTYFGLPTHHIDRAIRWHPNLDDERTRREGFPSWSWASYHGQINHSPSNVGLALWAVPNQKSATEITICRPSQGLQWDDYPSTTNAIGEEKQHILWTVWLAWTKGCINRACPSELTLGSAYGRFQDLFKRWPTYDVFWQEAFDGPDLRSTFSHQDCQVAASGYGRILVHTQVTCFRIMYSAIPRANSALSVQTSNGELIGRVNVSHRNQLDHGALCEFILLSVDCIGKCPNFFDIFPEDTSDNLAVKLTSNYIFIHQKYVDSLLYRHPDGDIYPFQKYDPHPFSNNFRQIPFATAMLIETDVGTNIARRVGIGEIALRKWVEACPEFKTIILE
ncbi:HET domain-containing protein [Aspergillus alliaceus]|uniref:HET domain-containing protein n=1 Tax=Petromyces alliaceus TaxID=209559 RepID=UPI0012A70483|nr:heterokaryon incompatibility protein-domain-containing protein [Aspergillus alliaceus]KAB8231582.1 heterokaryon incompatibility protein-domain-containing protein [Aspergillus alliaceus]